MQHKVDFNSAIDLKCSNCNGKLFRQVTILKVISALVSPDGRETLVPINIYECANCRKIPNDFLNAFKDEETYIN